MIMRLLIQKVVIKMINTWEELFEEIKEKDYAKIASGDGEVFMKI